MQKAVFHKGCLLLHQMTLAAVKRHALQKWK
jgi:hypothetical protein